MNCPKCGLPKFFGIGGYAGPQCLCDVTCGPVITIGEVHERIKLDDPLYKEGFQAGAASRDAEIHRLQMALADTEALELGTAEKCDQLREQVAVLRWALADIANDYSDRFDMDSSSTNPGMKFVVKQAREVLDATEPK